MEKNGHVFKFKTKLINGMLERGYELDFAERIFEQICGFGEYGFPESHSASFAVLAYCSAWLKHYYPAEFYTALLNSQPMGFYSPSQLVQDAKRHGIAVLPICVNFSNAEHQLVRLTSGELAIRLGFNLIKGLSHEGITRLLTHRPAQGYQCISEVKQILRQAKDIQSLASANAFYQLADNRYLARWQVMDNLDELPLFQTLPSTSNNPLPKPSDYQNVLEDYAATGLSLAEHPVAMLEKAGGLTRFTRANQLNQCSHRSLVTVIGLVTGKQSPGTAAGVTFFTLEDDTGNINVVVWQATSRAQKQAYLTARLLMVKGILEREGDVIHVIAGRLIDLTEKLSGLSPKSREFH